MEQPKAIKKKSSYCLKCIKRQLINLSEEKTENKTAQQKSRCVVCDSKKSTFLKKKTKKLESFKTLYIIKRMLSYCHYCQNYSKD